MICGEDGLSRGTGWDGIEGSVFLGWCLVDVAQGAFLIAISI